MAKKSDGKKRNRGNKARRHPPVRSAAMLVGELASKSSVVVAAIVAQLEADHQKLDLNKTMDDYNYDGDDMLRFLGFVRRDLFDNEPPYYFTFDRAFALAAVDQNVRALANNVDGKTVTERPDDWVKP